MAYGSPDPYYNPEKFGLEIFTEFDNGGSYEFDMFVVWKDANGNYYWATDAGCSCPSPFETFDSIEDLTESDREGIVEAFDLWTRDDVQRYEMRVRLFS